MFSASSGSRCFCCDYAPSQGSRSLCEPVMITDLFNRGRRQRMVWIFQRKQFDSMYPPYSLFCKRNLDVNQCLVYPTPSLHVTSYTVLSQLNAVKGHTHFKKKPKPNHKSTHVSVVRSVLAKLGRAAQRTLPKMGLLIREC